MTTESTQYNQEALFRLKDVKAKTGISRSTIYRLMEKNEFPKPIHPFESRISAWVGSEIEEWVKDQIKKGRDHRR